jgi:formylglycine-generating enzyme required for sulfatase activity
METGLMSFGTGTAAKVISQLRNRLKKKKSKYAEALEAIKGITHSDPLKIAKYYVEPDVQDRNPADIKKNDVLPVLIPAIKLIDTFFRQKTLPKPGRNHLFILSDAGMGKTSLLTILKLMHLTSLWPWQTDCVFKKLGEETISELKDLPNPQKIILLLDGLNEDSLAYGRVKNRLMDILHASKYFYRVIITCRTQFFPDMDKELLNRVNMFSIGEFTCHIKYLSFFSDEKLTLYLNKRFPKNFGILRQSVIIQQGQKAIGKLGSLRCRPVLMRYIDDLMRLPLVDCENNEYCIYDALVQKWIKNEWSLKNKQISENDILELYSILATRLQTQKKHSISKMDLDQLLDNISTVKDIQDITSKDLSLLNRDSESCYSFDHYSVQEFLVAKLLLHGQQVYSPKVPVPLTDLIFRMIGLSDQSPKFPLDISALNFRGMDLKRLNFSGMNFSGIDLENCIFEDTVFHRAQFIKAKLKGSRIDVNAIDAADFKDADLTGAQFINKRLGMVFVYIPPGKFMMGDEKTGNIHEVTLTKGFLMQTTPVTQSQWEKVMGNNPSGYKKNGSACPVENVSWKEVQAFIHKLNVMEKANYNLPTEAQWDYACRAGSKTKYHFGDQESELKNYAWFKSNSNKRTHPVAKLRPNAWGLYDMHGNVWEWCRDWYDSYPDHSVTDPAGPDSGVHRVVRGGSWYVESNVCRTAYRDGGSPKDRATLIGFRLVRLSW